jgi:hypothetical protein
MSFSEMKAFAGEERRREFLVDSREASFRLVRDAAPLSTAFAAVWIFRSLNRSKSAGVRIYGITQ